jgi:hypothetical protein
MRKAPARAAITLPVKSQYTQQDTVKIVVTCTAEDLPHVVGPLGVVGREAGDICMMCAGQGALRVAKGRWSWHRLDLF